MHYLTVDVGGSGIKYAVADERYVLRDKGVPKGMSGSVYTQITDVEGEHNGLLTYDRKIEKVDEARVRAINQATIRAGDRP